MARPKVAVLRTTPETVLEDYQHLCELAGLSDALDPSATRNSTRWRSTCEGGEAVNSGEGGWCGTNRRIRAPKCLPISVSRSHEPPSLPGTGRGRVQANG